MRRIGIVIAFFMTSTATATVMEVERSQVKIHLQHPPVTPNLAQNDIDSILRTLNTNTKISTTEDQTLRTYYHSSESNRIDLMRKLIGGSQQSSDWLLNELKYSSLDFLGLLDPVHSSTVDRSLALEYLNRHYALKMRMLREMKANIGRNHNYWKNYPWNAKNPLQIMDLLNLLDAEEKLGPTDLEHLVRIFHDATLETVDPRQRKSQYAEIMEVAASKVNLNEAAEHFKTQPDSFEKYAVLRALALHEPLNFEISLQLLQIHFKGHEPHIVELFKLPQLQSDTLSHFLLYSITTESHLFSPTIHKIRLWALDFFKEVYLSNTHNPKEATAGGKIPDIKQVRKAISDTMHSPTSNPAIKDRSTEILNLLDQGRLARPKACSRSQSAIATIMRLFTNASRR